MQELYDALMGRCMTNDATQHNAGVISTTLDRTDPASLRITIVTDTDD